MQLTKALKHQAAKAMVPATRRGDVWWFYGSKGDVYKVTPQPNGSVTCECGDYVYRRAALGEDCKHGREVRNRPPTGR